MASSLSPHPSPPPCPGTLCTSPSLAPSAGTLSPPPFSATLSGRPSLGAPFPARPQRKPLCATLSPAFPLSWHPYQPPFLSAIRKLPQIYFFPFSLPSLLLRFLTLFFLLFFPSTFILFYYFYIKHIGHIINGKKIKTTTVRLKQRK